MKNLLKIYYSKILFLNILNQRFLRLIILFHFKGSALSSEHYAAFLYTQALRVLPAVVRKWYNGSNTRQAQLVDKITTKYVTPIICQEELSALITKREREKDNMNVS